MTLNSDTILFVKKELKTKLKLEGVRFFYVTRENITKILHKFRN